MNLTDKTQKSKKSRALAINVLLKQRYQFDPGTGLSHTTPLDLLVATILSAQCTDARVNEVVKSLFARYRTAEDYANVAQETLEQDIKSTGFYRNKAKNIIACCRMLISDYGGEVPEAMEDLVKLPGVGRKTANLVRGIIYGRPAIITDTHVIRLSQRLGLTTNKDPEKIEYDLNALLPESDWTEFTSRLILLGREVCTARKPSHEGCILREVCPSAGI